VRRNLREGLEKLADGVEDADKVDVNDELCVIQIEALAVAIQDLEGLARNTTDNGVRLRLVVTYRCGQPNTSSGDNGSQGLSGFLDPFRDTSDGC